MPFQLDRNRVKPAGCNRWECVVKNPRAASPSRNEYDGWIFGISSFDNANAQPGAQLHKACSDTGKSLGVQPSSQGAAAFTTPLSIK